MIPATGGVARELECSRRAECRKGRVAVIMGGTKGAARASAERAIALKTPGSRSAIGYVNGNDMKPAAPKSSKKS